MKKAMHRGHVIPTSLLVAAVLLAGCGSSHAPAPSSDSDDPSGRQDSVDLSCDHATYPSALWTQCEAENHARILVAPTELAANPAYAVRWAEQSAANLAGYLARLAADPSWLLASNPLLSSLLASMPSDLADTLQAQIIALQADPSTALSLSLNTPLTPLCGTWSLPCTGDPYRYPGVNGPDGDVFYTTEGQVEPIVFYDDQCARLSGRIWMPRHSPAGAKLPAVVIENGSIQAPETLYWWAAQMLVRNGYAVMTFDPRGQGRSDWQTPAGAQGGNLDANVFVTGLVNAIDFFRSSPKHPYPWNQACAARYPTAVTVYNPFHDRVDPSRLGIAGHSAGAVGVSVVQGLGANGARAWPGQIDSQNPVKVAVAWDGLHAGPGIIGIDDVSVPRVPSLSLLSEYLALRPGLNTGAPSPLPFLSPPDPVANLDAFQSYVEAGVPVYAITTAGSTHFDYSQLPGFPASSWCPDTRSGACRGGWAIGQIEHYTLAWFDRWLKKPGETGYADADTRLLDDNGPQGRAKMSWHYHSARSFMDRDGRTRGCDNLRSGCRTD